MILVCFSLGQLLQATYKEVANYEKKHYAGDVAVSQPE